VEIDLERLDRLVPAVGHDQRNVVSGGFHHVGNEGMTQAVAGEALDLTIIEFCEFCGLRHARAIVLSNVITLALEIDIRRR
jgi:hypothetical protein